MTSKKCRFCAIRPTPRFGEGLFQWSPRCLLLSLIVLTMLSLAGTWAMPFSRPWQLVFCDEFDGARLNTAVWNTVPRWGRFDKKGDELQYYVDDAFEVSDGTLRIKAEKRSVEGFDYTSGFIDSRGTFAQKYGYFEIRAKMPQGQGFWPAFWLLCGDDIASPSEAEIDVFEYLGHQTNTVYMTNHWIDGNGEHQSFTESYTGPDFSKEFHTFAVEWSSSEIIWYVDGEERHRTSQGVSSEPLFLVANLAIGGQWPGDPDASTPSPSYLEIDYIRVYERTWRCYLPKIFRP
jgi:beta-glucanase (GH16 family)